GLIGVSDTSAAKVEQVTTITINNGYGGVPQLMFSVRYLNARAVTIRATVGTVGDSVVAQAVDPPPTTGLMTVESFQALEFRPACAAECPYIVYAPSIAVKAAPELPVEILGVEFSVPTLTTGMCAGSLDLSPGSSAKVGGMDPYL